MINFTFDDNDGLVDKRAVFIGHFILIDLAPVRQLLCNLYCTIFLDASYGHHDIDKSCAASRRAIKRVWPLLFTTHRDLVPLP